MPQSTKQQLAQSLRDAEVLKLRAEGVTYAEIAQRLGFANRSGAQKAFRRALLRIPEEVAAARDLAQARTDALIEVLWPVALDSTHPDQYQAIEQIRQIMHDTERRFGLGGGG